MKIPTTLKHKPVIVTENYDNIDGHIKKLGDTYLAKIAGTPSTTGPATKGFVTATPAAG